MLRTCLNPILILALALAGAVGAQKGKDPLSKAFGRWLRDFKAGKVHPHRLATRSYLPKDYQDPVPTEAKARRSVRLAAARLTAA